VGLEEPPFVPQEVLKRLIGLRDQAEHLLAKPFIRDSEIDPWCAQAKDTLEESLGYVRAMNYVHLVTRSNWQKAVYGESEEEAEQDDIHEGLSGAITTLAAFIKQLQAAPSSAKELDQKFKILYSAGQVSQDFEDYKSDLSKDQQPLAVIFLDIDHFGDLNTRYTETIVDRTMFPAFQKMLATLVKGHGAAYRQGGDEFVLLLPNHEAPECGVFAERVRRTFEHHQFDVDGKPQSVTVSIGYALHPDHGESYDDVLLRANEAKRIAKQTRNSVKMGSLSLTTESPLRALGLTMNAQRLVLLLNQRSKHALNWDPMLSADDVTTALTLSAEDAGDAAHELEGHGWVRLNKASGMGKAWFSDIGTHPQLFIDTDPFVTGNDPRTDAKTIARVLVDSGGNDMTVPELDKLLQWGPRRLNPAIYLIVDQHNALGCAPVTPYHFSALIVTPATRRLAKERH
jgi:diguanylate cyclase (GGDEF)-like protein